MTTPATSGTVRLGRGVWLEWRFRDWQNSDHRCGRWRWSIYDVGDEGPTTGGCTGYCLPARAERVCLRAAAKALRRLSTRLGEAAEVARTRPERPGAT